MKIEIMEESPLQCRKASLYRKVPTTPERQALKLPFRVFRLCLLSILLPGIFIAGPLYIRHHLYSSQLYPLAMSDMRLIDNRVSTTWCQRQMIRVNTTFNAYLLKEQPKMFQETKPLSMIRELFLEDDMKEYWGFYLLKDSVVTVSSCSRWPGSSLTIIRGHKHLHECAYIGDDSSEEIDEWMRQIREEGVGDAPKLDQKNNIQVAKSVNVSDDGNQTETPTSNEDSAPDNNPGLMKRHRSGIQFHHPIHSSHKNHTLEAEMDSEDDAEHTGQDMKKLLVELYEKTEQKGVKRRKVPDNIQNLWKQHISSIRNQGINQNEQSNLQLAADARMRQRKSDQAPPTSAEMYDEIMQRLGTMPVDSRKNVLKRLQYKREMKDNKLNITNANERVKRDILVKEIAMKLNVHDEERDAAVEEGMSPDAIADHRGTINETTVNDRSNSEFWSSFSSSEERLLNCEGLILNLPLASHDYCEKHRSNEDALGARSLPNRVTYIVPSNGYYFFVFNSENEAQVNYLRLQFDLLKTKYDVANAVANCTNSTSTCAMQLRFFSNERLVLELPVRNNDSLWNEEFVVVSECEPRTAIYIACVVAVPMLFMFFAFQ